MEKYRKTIAELLSNTSITKDRIFDYAGSPLEKEFDSAFEFYMEALSQNAVYGIAPSLLYFDNDRSVNAFASKQNDHYIIGINVGTIKALIDMFGQKNLLVSANCDDFLDFEKHLNAPTSEIMLQEALHFTFYHEMAHLIQKSEFLEVELNERANQEITYSSRRHLLELDADQFSSLCLGAHTLQYAKDCFGEGLDKEKLEKLLVIMCSSALFYMLSFQTNKLDIYYEEKSHPHPVIRITCIVFHMVGYCIQSLNQEGKELNIDAINVVNESIRFSNELSKAKFKSNQIEDYKAVLGNEAESITKYIKNMQELEANDNTLAAYKWNQNAKRIANEKTT